MSNVRSIIQTLRTAALRHPGAEEGVACEGTAIEKRTIKVAKRAFLFLGTSDLMLKLGPSIAAANALAAKKPGWCRVGAGGWTKIDLNAGTSDLRLLKKWVDESYELFAAAATPRTKGRAGRK